MVKISSEKKNLEKQTDDYKNEILSKYDIRLYDDEEQKTLYKSELNNFNKYISEKVNKKVNQVVGDNDDEDIKINEDRMKKTIIKNLET